MPQYQHTIVISPSTTNDNGSVSQLIADRLFNNVQAQQRLKQLIPNWIGTFNTSDTILMNRPRPTFRQTPAAVRISYYNATFSVKLWNKARIHAIML
jgi:flavoprotein